MTDSMRDRIAQVIDKSLDGDCGYGVGEHLADVLLAEFPVLAGPTDEMVEKVARALFEVEWAVTESPPSWEDEGEFGLQEYWRDAARAALVAAREARTP